MSYLVLDRLTKRYGANAAVDGVSLEVGQGELVALLGPSGCGKTTTLQMIAGFVEPTSGAARLDGRDLIAMKPNDRGLGIVFQSYALFPHMTAAENVAFGLEMRGLKRAAREARVAEVLKLVGLGALADRYPRRMSGGQQQRVALARALVIKPQVLLLDEPLSNLDAKLREEMQVELRQIQRTLKTTTILVTHDQGEAMALADRIVVMNAGKVEQIGAPFEIYERPASPFVASFLGKTNIIAARVDEKAGEIAIGGARWPAPNVEGGEARVLVRPEKVRFVAAADNGVSGTVRTRIFQGDHWLYEVETAAGPVSIMAQNVGGGAPGEGDGVRIGWRSEDMRIDPRKARAP